MIPKPAEPDRRTRVDRVLSRIKNNPAIAALLVIGIGITALASFTESAQKLIALIPHATTNFDGRWMSVEPDADTTVKTILVFDFKTDNGELLGTIHHGYAQPLLNGKVAGNKMTFDVDQQWNVGDEVTVERRTYRGKFADGKIHFARTSASEAPFEFTAIRKIQRPLPPALRMGGVLAKTKLTFSNGRHVWIMNADGSNKKRLSKDDVVSETAPAWSPDASQIAYEGHKTVDEFGIYVIRADASNDKPVVVQRGFWTEPSWSPDGMRLVLAASDAGSPGLYLVNADGSHLIRLTKGEHRVPAFSPDGRKLVFQSGRSIVVMDSDGSNPRELGEGDHPAWSPDGTKIAFDRNGEENSRQIVVMNADGSNPISLTEDWAQALHPTWSPDGTLLAFVSNREGESEIFVMNADGSNPVNVSDELNDYEMIAWSPVLKK